MVHSTMMDHPLTVRPLRARRRVQAASEVVTWRGDHARRFPFADTDERARRLTAGLRSPGIERGDVVGESGAP
jgi:non-ribosomal peptide synthetase component E (peptide arylation enzyme)